jgi:hypothetical protein
MNEMQVVITSRERDRLLKICDKLHISEDAAVCEGIRMFIVKYGRVLEL